MNRCRNYLIVDVIKLISVNSLSSHNINTNITLKNKRCLSAIKLKALISMQIKSSIQQAMSEITF